MGYVVSLLILFSRLNKPDWSMQAVRGIALVTLVFAMGVTIIAGVVYGSQSMRPFWASGDIPIAFLVESLLGGFAFIIFFTYLAGGFPWNLMGSVWAFAALPVQGAAYVGVHGLSLATILLAGLPVLGGRWVAGGGVALAGIAGLGALRLAPADPPAQDLQLLLVQGRTTGDEQVHLNRGGLVDEQRGIDRRPSRPWRPPCPHPAWSAAHHQ